MKIKTHHWLIMSTLLALATFNLPLSMAQAQGTAFTYQGRLNLNSAPANGRYDLQFALFATNQFGSPVSPVLTNAAVTVTNGLLLTTLDFGAGVFTGTNYWLDISVRTNGNGNFSELSPRQFLAPTPYAVNALTAKTAASLTAVVQNNILNGGGETVGGGNNNATSNFNSTISGGANNISAGNASTVGGGSENHATGDHATIMGGQGNISSGDTATVGGGDNNAASYTFATVSGGANNTASGIYSTVSGGLNNTASGNSATVGGGDNNTAQGDYSFAAGNDAQATYYGDFVWADTQGGNYYADRANQFKVRAGGGVLFDVANSSGLSPAAVAINSTSGNGVGLNVSESSSDAALVVGNNGTGDLIKGFSGNGNVPFEVKNNGALTCQSLTQTSDRNAKENFKPLDSQTVLAKVVSLPMSEWNYKTDSQDVQHIGPMAQDFHAAFALNGADDKHISVVDEGGVALAAIQGLNQQLQEKDAEIKTLEKQLNELQAEVKSISEKK